MDKIIYLSSDLNCSPDIAFDHFTLNHLLTKWLTVKADVELRQEGKYELFWSPQETDPTHNSTYGCKILAFDKPHFITFEWRGNAEQKSFMNHVRPLTQVIVMFHPLAPDKTTVSLIHSGWREDSQWEDARKYFIKAWSGAFLHLEKLINHGTIQ